MTGREPDEQPPARLPVGPAVDEAQRLTVALLDFADELDQLGERVRKVARQRVAERERERTDG